MMISYVSAPLPHVGLGVVRGEGDGALHAGQRHVVLLRVEAAQAEVVEQLGAVGGGGTLKVHPFKVTLGQGI